MRNKMTISLLAAMMAAIGPLGADKYTRDQLKSMEFMQWKFTPKSYYYSWDYKRVLGIKIPIPGLGVHDRGPAGVGIGGDNYVNESWRMMSPLRATAMASSALQAGNANNERENWNDIMLKDMVTYVDASTDLPVVGAWEVTKNGRDTQSQRVLDVIYELGDDQPGIADDIQNEYDTIREEMNIIHNAHMDNARKVTLLEDGNNRLQELAESAEARQRIQTYIQFTDGWDELLNQ